jgi:hypothetical protein
MKTLGIAHLRLSDTPEQFGEVGIDIVQVNGIDSLQCNRQELIDEISSFVTP